jgi:hypothetical protein
VGLGLIALSIIQRRIGSLEKVAAENVEPDVETGVAHEAVAQSKS